MTNAEMIFIESQKLAEEGKIGYTGRTFKALNMAGEEVDVKETEAIHTYQTWKDMGYQVQKGQKAVTKIRIWKYVSKKNEETDEDNSKMFMKVAAFFSRSQVEAIA